MKNIFAVVVAAIFVLAAGNAIAASKVGLVNVAQVVKDSKAGRDAKAKFDGETASKANTLKEREADIKKLQDEVQKEYNQESKARKAEKLEKNIKEYNRMKADFEDELKKTDTKLSVPLLKDIMAVAASVAKEEGFSVVLDSTKLPLVYAEEGADITQKVIKRYDETKGGKK